MTKANRYISEETNAFINVLEAVDNVSNIVHEALTKIYGEETAEEMLKIEFNEAIDKVEKSIDKMMCERIHSTLRNNTYIKKGII